VGLFPAYRVFLRAASESSQWQTPAMPPASPKAGFDISRQIVILRGQRVLLDSDLAVLYGVTTARLNQQVRRNRERFPVDFAFKLSRKEITTLMLQNATSSWGGRRKPPSLSPGTAR
jgi:hypothetical protein